MYKFELICLGLAMSDQAQLIFDSQKKINFIPLLIPEILDFQESFTIGWKVRYHNNFPFRQFPETSNEFFLSINNIKCPFFTLFAQI